MEKHLIRQRDIESLTGVVGLQGVVLVRPEKNEMFVDLVLADSDKFFRVCHREGKKERVFKSISTATQLLLDEGFPEVIVKVDRPILGADNLHTNQ